MTKPRLPDRAAILTFYAGFAAGGINAAMVLMNLYHQQYTLASISSVLAVGSCMMSVGFRRVLMYYNALTARADAEIREADAKRQTHEEMLAAMKVIRAGIDPESDTGSSISH